MIDSVPNPRPMSDSRRQAHRALLEAAVAAPEGATSRRWRGRGIAVAAMTGLALTGATAAAAYVAFAPATDTSVVRCYSDTIVGSGNDFHGTTVAVADPNGSGPVAITDALAACTQVWTDGVITEGALNAQGPTDEGVRYAVPSLSACVAADGVAVVFPGVNVCAGLGLPTLHK